MDSVKRALLRARRLQRTLDFENAFTGNVPRKGPFSPRPTMLNSEAHSLRSAINNTVQAFVSPSLPITTGELMCTDVLVELRRGSWILNARVEAFAEAPIAFIIGFTVNKHRYFGFLLGLVNVPGASVNVSSPTKKATVSISGVSTWLSFNFETACREGVTFRLWSTSEIDTVSLRNLFDAWLGAFPEPLYRPMSLLDDGKSDYDAWGTPHGEGSLLDDNPGVEPGLSFEVSLNFD